MTRLIVRRGPGGAVAVVIPKCLADQHRLLAGSAVYAVETSLGILITTDDPATIRDALRAYDQIAGDYREALRALAN